MTFESGEIKRTSLVQLALAGTAVVIIGLIAGLLTGCSGLNGYSDASLYPNDIRFVYVEMFDNRSFRRGVEYTVTNALAKRIDAKTPYKVTSNRDRADSIISGQLISIGQASISTERQTGRSLEKEVRLDAVVNWKNLKSGKFLLERQKVSAAAAYSEWQRQGFDYASDLASNILADRIVEAMEKKW